MLLEDRLAAGIHVLHGLVYQGLQVMPPMKAFSERGLIMLKTINHAASSEQTPDIPPPTSPALPFPPAHLKRGMGHQRRQVIRGDAATRWHPSSEGNREVTVSRCGRHRVVRCGSKQQVLCALAGALGVPRFNMVSIRGGGDIWIM